jgi:hypothetical protein
MVCDYVCVVQESERSMLQQRQLQATHPGRPKLPRNFHKPGTADDFVSRQQRMEADRRAKHEKRRRAQAQREREELARLQSRGGRKPARRRDPNWEQRAHLE